MRECNRLSGNIPIGNKDAQYWSNGADDKPNEHVRGPDYYAKAVQKMKEIK